MLKILYDYLDLANPRHLRCDFFVPLALVLCTALLLVTFNVGAKDVLIKTSSIIGIVITAFSILAGFNATSLSIFATSKSKVAEILKNQLIEGTNRAKIEQLFAYFSWSVIVQLLLLFFSIIISFIFTYVPPDHALVNKQCTNIIFWTVFYGGVFGITYSILLTIRNITILYDFLIAESRNN